MNWARGLFRAWVVCSLLWVALVAVYAPSEIRLVYAPVILHDGDQRLEFPANTPPAAVRKAVLDYLKEKFAKVAPPPQGFVIQYDEAANTIIANFQYRPLWAAVLKIIGAMLSVPAGLLLVGIAGWWVGRCFIYYNP
jgi:hypothetical protein